MCIHTQYMYGYIDKSFDIYISKYKYVHIYMYIHICTCIYVCMWVCFCHRSSIVVVCGSCACVCVCMCVCVCVTRICGYQRAHTRGKRVPARESQRYTDWKNASVQQNERAGKIGIVGGKAHNSGRQSARPTERESKRKN